MSDERAITRYGWHPSLPDVRDHIADLEGLAIAPEVDPRGAYMTGVYDQLQLGSCVSNAVAAAIDAYLMAIGRQPFFPSRLDLYWHARKVAGLPTNEDTGAYGRDGFKVARSTGVMPERDWPYNISKFATDPRHRDIWKLDSSYRVVGRTVDAWKRVFTQRQTIAFGFSVFDSFESQRVADTGIVPYPDTTREQMLGGHEVLAVGYLKSHPEHVLVRNSWGDDWGDGGYCLFPWSYIMDRNLADDFRTIRIPS